MKKRIRFNEEEGKDGFEEQDEEQEKGEQEIDERNSQYQRLRKFQKRFRDYIHGKVDRNVSPEEREDDAMQVSGELVRVYDELAKFDEEDGDLEKAEQHLERKGFYLATIADHLVKRDDVFASSRYRSAAIQALGEAERYASETRRYEDVRKIKDLRKKQKGELEKIADDLGQIKRRIAAVILCGVMSLVFSVGKISGYVAGNAGDASSALGMLFFLVGCIFLSLLIRKRK